MDIDSFPKGTEFYIKEYDVPVARIPNIGWFNYYGGQQRAYDIAWLSLNNNWLADSFEEWVELVEASK